MNGWKYIAGAGIAGFVVSLLSGFISGNPIGVVFFRSFLSAIVLAGLAVGVGFVIKKYFPELESIIGERKGPESKETDRVGGEEVDIVIPEENPHSSGEPEEAEEVEILNENEGIEVESGVEILDEDVEPGSKVQEGSGTSGEEVKEESNESVSNEPESDIVTGVVDTLPELEGLQLDSVETGSVENKSGTSGNRSVKSDVLGTEVDPSTLAKAVRSFMKKDEEG